jgi:hypothetical protein
MQLSTEQARMHNVINAFVVNTFGQAADAFAKKPNGGQTWRDMKEAMYLAQAWNSAQVGHDGKGDYPAWLDHMATCTVNSMQIEIFRRAHGDEWKKEVVLDK